MCLKPYRTRFTQILGILTLSSFYINKMSELSTWIQAFNEGSNFTLKKKIEGHFFQILKSSEATEALEADPPFDHFQNANMCLSKPKG